MPELIVSPTDALMDEKISIKVTGLDKQQPVTLHCTVNAQGARFASYGCYVTDENGNVDLSRHPSLRGTYSGIEEMGLFWSMKGEPGQKRSLRLIKKDVTSPLDFTIKVYQDHLTWDEIYSECPTPLANVSVRRWYMAKYVQRLKVRTGNIRGALFIPKGKGPHPCVIDLFGGTGGLMDFRAALLASRGFLALSLAYINYEDIKIVNSTEYFKEAIDYLLSLPMAMNQGVGIVGVSAGGSIALLLATYLEKVKSVVVINGLPYQTIPIKHDNCVIGPPAKGGFDISKGEQTEEGIVFRNAYWGFDEENVFKVWDKDVNILLVVGSNDESVSSDIPKSVYRFCPAEKKSRIELLEYQGAGHLIEPPYSPHCRASYVPIYGINQVWGGYAKEHAFAQEDSWKKILSFLRQTLITSAKSRL